MVSVAATAIKRYERKRWSIYQCCLVGLGRFERAVDKRLRKTKPFILPVYISDMLEKFDMTTNKTVL